MPMIKQHILTGTYTLIFTVSDAHQGSARSSWSGYQNNAFTQEYGNSRRLVDNNFRRKRAFSNQCCLINTKVAPKISRPALVFIMQMLDVFSRN